MNKTVTYKTEIKGDNYILTIAYTKSDDNKSVLMYIKQNSFSQYSPHMLIFDIKDFDAFYNEVTQIYEKWKVG